MLRNLNLKNAQMGYVQLLQERILYLLRMMTLRINIVIKMFWKGWIAPCVHLCNRWFPSCISPLFQSESKCKAFHMEISFIHMQILVHLHVNKTNFHMKGFAVGVAWDRGEMQLGNCLLLHAILQVEVSSTSATSHATIALSASFDITHNGVM